MDIGLIKALVQLGFGGVAIGVLAGLLYMLIKNHKEEREEWRKSSKEERDEWKQEIKQEAEQTRKVIAEFSSIIRDIYND